MIEISALLACLSVCVDKTTINQLSVIVSAIIAMTGRVTMLGISRWTEKGGSYRTIQRFFSSKIAWSKLQWHFIRMHLLNEGDEVILVGDESVVTKSGKHTYGLDRFFSSLYGKVIPVTKRLWAKGCKKHCIANSIDFFCFFGYNHDLEG